MYKTFAENTRKTKIKLEKKKQIFYYRMKKTHREPKTAAEATKAQSININKVVVSSSIKNTN